MQEQEELKKLRNEIDGIDGHIISLISKRFAAAKRIGVIKKGLGIEVLQPQREREVIEKVRTAARNSGIDEALAEKLFVEIMAASKRVQK